MFREMRRKKQLLSAKESIEILNKGTSGVLALLGDDGYPYSIPISYVYDDGKIYFHSAKSGHKIDAILKSEKASFCVIDKDQIVPDKYTSYFRSVIAFGKLHIIEDEAEKRKGVEKLALKYAPDNAIQNRDKEINSLWTSLCVLEMTIEHMTGKEAIELVKSRTDDK